jgi:hypothetical protein
MSPNYSYLVGGLLATVSPEEETEKLNQCAELGWELSIQRKAGSIST